MDVFNAMVVRTVKRKEMLSTPAAMKAMDDEWNKLSKQIVWDLNTGREQDEDAAQARSNNMKVHFGDIFGICGVNSRRAILLRNGKADSYSVEVMSKTSTMTLRSLMSYPRLQQRLKHQKLLTPMV